MKKTIIGIVLSVTLVLAGCNIGSSIEQQLSETMTVMNSAEKEYREAQAKLTDIEKIEQQLFNETMKLTQQQQDELAAKVTELEQFLEQRLDYLNEEDTSIEKAKVSVGDFDALIEKADDDAKQQIEELKNAIIKRYELHSAFVSEYQKLATLQRELYGMLRAEETQLPELKDKVNAVNAQNETVQSAVTSFNESTERVNVLKDDVFANFQQEK